METYFCNLGLGGKNSLDDFLQKIISILGHFCSRIQ